MTTYSKADLRNRVLRDLGVLDVARSASAPVAAVVDDIVQQSLEELEDESLVIFNSQLGETIENIPGRVFAALADFVRYHAAPSFPMGGVAVGKDDALRHSALTRLRRSVMAGSDDTPVKVLYY